MTKVMIQPGPCNLETRVEAVSEDGMEVQVKITSACESVAKITEVLGDTWDAYEVCLGKPGTGPLYEYAGEHMPGHASCPTIAGIIKCIEVECRLALPKDVTITFLKDE